MRVLIYTHYFYPEYMAAQSKRIGDFSRALHQEGHEVTVVTGFPSHARGMRYTGYEGEWFRREKWEEDVELLRCWSYIRPFRRGRTRILNHISFLIASVLQGSWATRDIQPDVVLSISPPLFTALAGALAARLRRVPHVLDLQDLWPEEAVAVGGLKNPLAVRLTSAVARFLYRSSTRIVVISEGFRRRVLEQGARKGAVEVIPNWVRPDSFVEWETAVLPGSGFRVVFAGTIGLAQGLFTLLDAAERMRDREVSFLLVGEGVEKERLREEASRRGLKNVYLLPAVEQAEVPGVLAAADALLVHLRPAEIFSSVIPSKTYEYLAAGRPVLMGVPGDAARVIEEADAGVCFGSGDPGAMASAVEQLMALGEDERRAMGERGREHVRSHFSVEPLTSRYVEVLREAVEEEA